jgi:hypothetical protein
MSCMKALPTSRVAGRTSRDAALQVTRFSAAMKKPALEGMPSGRASAYGEYPSTVFGTLMPLPRFTDPSGALHKVREGTHCISTSNTSLSVAGNGNLLPSISTI